MSRSLRLPAVAALALLPVLVSGCSSGTSAATNTEHTVENGIQTSAGTMVIRDAYFALNSDGSVSLYAAFYNAGAQADALQSVTPGSAAGLPSYTYTVTVPSGGIPVPSGNGIVLLETPATALPVTGLTPSVQVGDEIPVVFSFKDESAIDLTLTVESPDGDAPVGPAPSATATP